MFPILFKSFTVFWNSEDETMIDLPVFTGTNAVAANANVVVPLSPASSGDSSAYYHVALQNDLMSDSIGKGEVRAISPLDVAMLQDIGLTIIGTPPITQFA